MPILIQYHIYKHLALGLDAYKCDIALVALHNIYIYHDEATH